MRLLSRLFRKERRKTRRQPALESKDSPRRRTGDMPTYPRYRGKSKTLSHGVKRALKRLCLYGAIIGGLAFAWLYFTLPDIEELNHFTKAPSILIKTEQDEIIGSFGDIYGDYVPFNALPASLVDAVIATEDRNFYYHFGIDPFGLLRATVANIRARHVVQGGSTITQQVAKNVFLTPERSLTRKLREMILALKLEKRFSKQDIMSIYLNRVYLGAGNYGVDAASRRYFGKSARELTLSESAILAGLLKAPSRFAPTSNPELSRKRAEQVLLNMADAGFLTDRQAAKAREELTQAMSGRKSNLQSTLYFADWVMDQIPEYVGNVQQDLVVITTLRPDWQILGEKAIADVMDKEGESHDASQAALLSMTPDGAIRVMIGGRSYGASQFNRAAQSLRQPGSSFKLFVYLAGLEAGLTPESIIDDSPVTIPIVGGKWTPKNYSGRYEGPIMMKDAVAQSINTVAVQVAMEAGLDRVINMARRLGITSDLEAVPSIALGSTEVSLLELTNAYAHLAANGAIVNPYGILEIRTAQGELVYKRQASRTGQVLQPDIVNMMNEMLIGVIDSDHGTGRGARIGRPMAGKTGTTSDYRDAWFMGYTPALVTGVWVGNDDNSPMKKVTGGQLPASIWHNYMAAALNGVPVRGLPTGTTGFLPSLPWQDGVREYPQQPGERNDDRRPRDNDVELGPSFWNKLLR